MLEKHNNSKINNILGITLCTVLLVFALTKAPQSIASENVNDKKISYKFDKIPLNSILQLIFDGNSKEVIGLENIPNIDISIEAKKVSAIQIERLLLKCSGLKLKAVDDYYEIVKILNFNKDFSKTSQCIETINVKGIEK